MSDYIDIFIPSYHRPDNCKTLHYFLGIDWPPEKIHVFVDSETDDIEQYRQLCESNGCELVVSDMEEARRRYDYVHRASLSRRSVGQARNMFQDAAKERGIEVYVVQDDDTQKMNVRYPGIKEREAEGWEIKEVFAAVAEFITRQHIGIFGLSQNGDLMGVNKERGLLRHKVMNTTFYNTKYLYRGERGVQDEDTSMFVGIMNAGLFSGSLRFGVILKQMPSAMQSGGLTDLYNECKLLNKSLVCPIQFPSAIYAERQKANGARLHHHILNKFLEPRILRNVGGRGNIAWDTYPEDSPFTNEPKRVT